MAQPHGTADRLEALERRLAALEAVAFRPNAQQAASPALGDGDRLWALAGLKERVGGRSVVLFAGQVGLEGTPVYEWQQGAEVDSLLELDLGDEAGTLAALGHPVRLRLLRAVMRGQRSTAELGALDGLGTSGQLYHHLRELTAAGWLHSGGRGHYEVPPVRVVPLLTILAAAQR